MSKKNVFAILKFLLILIILALTLFPIYWTFLLAFSDGGTLSTTFPFSAHTFTLEHFFELFEKKSFGLSLKNSLFITIISLSVSLIFGTMCAYVLSRKKIQFSMKKPTMFWVLLVRVLPPIAFAIPLYTMMNQIGILNTKIPVVLAHILVCIPFIIWFMISFFASLPRDIEESASVDGASEWQIFRKIILPLVKPGLTAVAILSFMTSWNEYLYGVIFVQSPSNFTIPLTLATLNSEQEITQWGSIAAGGVISLIPIAIFVIFAQNYLISGLSSGAVKE